MPNQLPQECHSLLLVNHAYAGTIHYPVETELGPRIQLDLQLVLLHTGSCEVEIDGTLMHLPVGHVALLQPGHEERFVFSRKEETWHRWIAVTVSKIPDNIKKTLRLLPPHIPISSEMNQVTEIMLSILRDPGMVESPLLCTFGQAAIYLYMSECQRIADITFTHPSVLAVRALIQSRYQEALTLKQMAAEGHVSIEHLIRLFHRHEHKTPTQFLWNHRIEQGLMLLRNSGLPVTEIAYQCGFKTSHHFARLIKSHTGLSPSNVRQASWGKSIKSQQLFSK